MVHILILPTVEKRKNATTDKRFQHAATVALNYGETEPHPFINEYIWKGYLSKIDYWKTFEKDNSIITLNILYIKEKENVQVLYQKLIRIVRNK